MKRRMASSPHLFGDETAWRLGRVSFNPLKHIDPVGAILLPGLMVMPWRAKNSPLVKRRNNLIQREVRSRADECEDLPRMLLQWRSTPSAGHGFASPVFVKPLHPPNRRTDADLELLGRPTSGSSSFHKVNDAHSQLTGYVHDHDIGRKPVIVVSNRVVDPIAVVVDIHLRKLQIKLGVVSASFWRDLTFFTCMPAAVTPTTFPLLTSAKTSTFPAVCSLCLPFCLILSPSRACPLR
jgi:hypothetical protein